MSELKECSKLPFWHKFIPWNYCDNSSIYSHHGEIQMAFWATTIVMAIILFLAIVVAPPMAESANARNTIIEGLNCDQLEEYIADQKAGQTYAEHRYMWLCLDDKSLIFQQDED